MLNFTVGPVMSESEVLEEEVNLLHILEHQNFPT